MIYYHEWLGTTEDYDILVADIGESHVKPMPSINWKVNMVRVFDDHKQAWVTIKPGEYIMENDGVVWTDRGR